MNDGHFVKRARLRLACLGAATMFAAAALMFLIAIPARPPVRSMLVCAGILALMALAVCLLEAWTIQRELTRENLEEIEGNGWVNTKADLRELQARRGRT